MPKPMVNLEQKFQNEQHETMIQLADHYTRTCIFGQTANGDDSKIV